MSKERAKGTAFVSSLLPTLRQYYPRADHSALHGAQDIGDVVLGEEDRFVLEMKCRNTLAFSEWLKEAEVEAANYATKWSLGHTPAGVVVAKRRGITDPARQYALMTFGDFLRLVNP